MTPHVQVLVVNERGDTLTTVDVALEHGSRSCTCVAGPAGGDVVAVGGWQGFVLLGVDRSTQSWQTLGRVAVREPGTFPGSSGCQRSLHQAAGTFTATCLAWRPDATSLVVGSCGGEVALYEMCLKTERLAGGRVVVRHVSATKALVQARGSGAGRNAILLVFFDNDMCGQRLLVETILSSLQACGGSWRPHWDPSCLPVHPSSHTASLLWDTHPPPWCCWTSAPDRVGSYHGRQAALCECCGTSLGYA